MTARGRRASLAAAGVIGLVTGALLLAGAAIGDGDMRVGRAVLRNAEGERVAVVRMTQRADGKVAVRARATLIEPAGEFHGFHLHQTGVCDPEAIDPATGEPAPFYSAGSHLNPEGAPHGEHAGDFPVLLVNADGTASSNFVTDRFRFRDLFDRDGAAVIIHEGRDNYANIPATMDGEERYHSHVEDVFGPDSATLATGDAGDRYACGALRRVHHPHG